MNADPQNQVPTHKGWIGIDLDATLAEYHGWRGIDHIGEPIPRMLQAVKAMIAGGATVKIFTARVDHGPEAVTRIQDWLENNGLPRLEVTNVKDMSMIQLWDDRAVQVIPNKGIGVVEPASLALSFCEEAVLQLLSIGLPVNARGILLEMASVLGIKLDDKAESLLITPDKKIVTARK